MAPFAAVALLLLALAPAAAVQAEQEVRSETFLSAPFTLSPGAVTTRWSHFPFPRGHISLRSFNGEVVDENSTPVPLHDVYLHHWVVERFYQDANASEATLGVEALESARQQRAETAHPREPLADSLKGLTPVRNSGVCPGNLPHWFGAGSETRRTQLRFPAPYGIEMGNRDVIPEQKEEVWIGQIHAIDTRGTQDAWGCTECLCNLYNASANVEKYKKAGFIPPGKYEGGLFCCTEGMHCQLQKDYEGPPKTYYLRYTIEYVPYDECTVPLRVYLLDVTDSGVRSSTGDNRHACKVEYSVKPCEPHHSWASCSGTLEARVTFPASGSLVYGVGHLHNGGSVISLFGNDSRKLCESVPLYGQSSGAGDELGFIVGMTSCTYDKQGPRIAANETLLVRSTYNRLGGHTGVMGLWYLAFAADEDVNIVAAKATCSTPGALTDYPKMRNDLSIWMSILAFAAGVAVAGVLVVVINRGRWRTNSDYQPIDSAWPHA